MGLEIMYVMIVVIGGLKMNKFIITIEVNSTEESVRALVNHLENDILPNSFQTKRINCSFKLYEREFQGFTEEDIQHCALEYGYEHLSKEEINKVFDLCEKRFDANNGMNWDFINFIIGEIK